MTRFFCAVVALAACAAWADIPPADSIGCRDKVAGATCKKDDGAEATCQPSTCSRNDYSNGPPPKRVSYECLKCGAAATAVPEASEKKKSSCAAVPTEVVTALLALGLLRRRVRASSADLS